MIIFFVVFLFSFTGCVQNTNENKDKKIVFATVNEESINLAQYKGELERVKKSPEFIGKNLIKDKEIQKKLEEQALSNLVKQKIEIQEAKANGILINDKNVNKKVMDLKALYNGEANFKQMLKMQGMNLEEYKESVKQQMSKDALFNVLTKDVNVTDAEIEKNYRESSIESSKYKIRVILLNRNNRQDTEIIALANEILEKYKKGESFEQLAKTYSDDTNTKDNGGLLKNPADRNDFYVSYGQIGGDAEKSLLSMKTGEVSKNPIKTSNGYIILKVEEIKLSSFAEAKNVIAARLLELKKANLYQDYIEKAKAVVKIKYVKNEKEK